MSLEQVIAVVTEMQTQGIFTQTQATKLINAATAMLSTFGNSEEYKAKYDLFLALIGGKWI